MSANDCMYTVSDDDLTITVADDKDMDNYITLDIGDDTTSTLTLSDVMSDPFGTTGSMNNWSFAGSLDTEPSLVIGKHKITEATLEKLKALLDIVESDQDLKDLLATQIAMNKLSNTQE